MFKILGQKFCVEKEWKKVSRFEKISSHIIGIVGMGFLAYALFHWLFIYGGP